MNASVIAIGVFDGVHRGHQSLLALAGERAHGDGLPLVAVTFDPHPQAVVRPGTEPARLTSLPRRIELLLEHGADAVDVLAFDAPMSQLEPEEFVREHLVDRLGARTVVAGANFRFGRRASGDIDALRSLGDTMGFDVIEVGLQGDAVLWSSTRIRALVDEGLMEEAAEILGRPHRLEGTVVRGEQRGRELGYPTANVDLPAGWCLPPDGVYAARLVVDREALPAALSIGTNPQFDGRVRTVEAFALDRDDLELYGAGVAVDVVRRLRGQARFDSVEALVAQMGRDVDEARRILGSD